jgi:hypothetical protein
MIAGKLISLPPLFDAIRRCAKLLPADVVTVWLKGFAATWAVLLLVSHDSLRSRHVHLYDRSETWGRICELNEETASFIMKAAKKIQN